MVEAGIFVASRSKRIDVAVALCGAGIPLGGLRKLAAFLVRGEKDEALSRKYLAAVVRDVQRCAEAIEDLGRHSAKNRSLDRNMPVQPYEDAPQVDWGEERGVWEHDRKCRQAWCRVHSDHRSKEEVAAELGVRPGTLAAMLDRGRVLSAPPEWVPQADRIKRGKKEETPDDRVKRFRDQMRAARRNDT